jgi:predicted nucleic-acid-binding protein
MIGIDSNILLRYLLDDDPVWSARATRFVEEELTVEEPGYVNLVTLAEIIWTLRSSPRFDREKLATVIDGLLSFDKLVVAEADAVSRAVQKFRDGGAGLADFLIAELNAAAGASPTVTIDRKASQNAAFKRLT